MNAEGLGDWWMVLEESVKSGVESPLCELFKPMPRFVRCTGEWYNWAYNHWGTKWGDYDGVVVSVDRGDWGVMVGYRFLTAWNPPLALVNEIAKVASTVTLYYYEAGLGVGGLNRFKYGKLVEVTELDPHRSDAEDSYQHQLEELCSRGGFTNAF